MNTTTVAALVTPLLTKMGFILLGIEYAPARPRATMRLYIDRSDAAVTIDDCATASEHVNALLSVHDILADQCVVEVSSPGLDRLFFTLAQCEPYVDRQVTVTLHRLQQGRRKITAKLAAVDLEAGTITLDDGQQCHELPWTTIRKARLVPNFSFADKVKRNANG